MTGQDIENHLFKKLQQILEQDQEKNCITGLQMIDRKQ